MVPALEAVVVVADREDREHRAVALMALMAMVLVQALVVQGDREDRQIILDMVLVEVVAELMAVVEVVDQQMRFVATQVATVEVVDQVLFVLFGPEILGNFQAPV
jgi:Tfp pilus assembly ATPase PilU